jgi:hypothetical protein
MADCTAIPADGLDPSQCPAYTTTDGSNEQDNTPPPTPPSPPPNDGEEGDSNPPNPNDGEDGDSNPPNPNDGEDGGVTPQPEYDGPVVVPDGIQTLLDGFAADYIPTLSDGCRYGSLSAPFEADNGKYFGYAAHCTTNPEAIMRFTYTDTASNWANTVDDCSNVLLS